MSVNTVAVARRSSRPLVHIAVAVVIVALLAYIVGALLDPPARASREVPQSAALEKVTGVRFIRIAEVGDGGLLTLSYVVLDAEKATLFQADRENVPTLSSQARDLSTHRVSLMRNGGHVIRPGQTYYFVYQNTAGALRAGETATITYDGVSLRNFPVL